MRKTLLAGLIALLALTPLVAAAQSNPFPFVVTAVMQSAAAATGNGSTLDTSHAAIATIQTSGTFVGTVTYEASLDGTNWVSLFCNPLAATSPITGVTAVATATTAVIARCNVTGIPLVRARVSAYTSGAITAIGNAVSNGNTYASPN